MRILFLTQILPFPLDAGPKIRAYYVLRHLAAEGHEITLLSFIRSSDRTSSIEHLRQFCVDVRTVPMQRSRINDGFHLLRSLISNTPFLIARDRVDAMQHDLRDLLVSHSYDVIHADQLWMAQYALQAQAFLQGNGASTILVLDQHNAVHLIPQRLAGSESSVIKRKLLQREARIMKWYELETCDRFDYVVWVSDEDRLALSRPLAKLASDRTIPICVDPDAKKVVDRKNGSLRVTFLGGLHWPPNADGVAWFAREVWPKVLPQDPEALLTVIGKNPPRSLLESEEAIPNLEVTGNVEDPLPYLAETTVFIVPLHAGGGMRVKIIDAWSWGLPVVSTSIGAEGVQYRHGDNLLIADDADTFADAVLRLLNDPELGDCLARAGRNTVETQYDWRKIYGAWEQVYPRAE